MDLDFRNISSPGSMKLKMEQAQQMIPLITREISFGQHVRELILGVNVFDFNFWVKINPIKQPIKCNSVGSGNMSQCRASFL